MRRSWMVLLIAALLAPAGCETYVAPPKVLIRGASAGALEDPRAPIELLFSKPIDASTLAVKIVPLETDVEGNLLDEQVPPKPLSPLFQHDPGTEEDLGGSSALVEGGTLFRIAPGSTMPVGKRLALLVEAGLSDTEGHVVQNRQRLVFGYEVRCAGRPTALFPSGKYFILLDVEKPIPVQIRLWTDIAVDPETGRFVAQFTSGIRNRDPGRCPGGCKESEACRTLPDPPGAHCVIPSEKAGTPDEFPDYVPNPSPPTGFTFTVPGCVQDLEDGTIAFANAPVDVSVQQPPVTIKALQLTASFAKDEAGVLRASGSGGGDDVVLGTSSSGPGTGTVSARSLDDSAWPKDAPLVPYGPEPLEGGAP